MVCLGNRCNHYETARFNFGTEAAYKTKAWRLEKALSNRDLLIERMNHISLCGSTVTTENEYMETCDKYRWEGTLVTCHQE